MYNRPGPFTARARISQVKRASLLFSRESFREPAARGRRLLFSSFVRAREKLYARFVALVRSGGGGGGDPLVSWLSRVSMLRSDKNFILYS